MVSPQTDAFLIEGGNYSYAGLADFARQLERKWDEARTENELLREALSKIRDATRTSAVTLRGMADYALQGRAALGVKT